MGGPIEPRLLLRPDTPLPLLWFQSKSSSCCVTPRRSGMASARCETCGGPQGLKQNYTHPHDQIPLPNKHILCGGPNCARLALIWLTDEEEQQYLQGVRVFRVLSRTLEAQVR